MLVTKMIIKIKNNVENTNSNNYNYRKNNLKMWFFSLWIWFEQKNFKFFKKQLNHKDIFYKKFFLRSQTTPFHIVPKSPWPFSTSWAILIFLLGIVLYFQYYLLGLFISFFGFFSISFFLTRWFLDIILESFKGNHTSYVANGLRLGFVLLIVSEVMFFFSFFWSYFHLTLSLSVHTGAIWPYVEGPWACGLPFLNTLILALSSITLTEAHLFFLKKEKFFSIFFFIITIFLAVHFTFNQFLEYLDSSLSFDNGACGSIFYMLTGFHGIHVLLGTIFLIVTLIRILKGHFVRERHILLEISSLYWHFVDVVWFFLFIVVYILGDF